MAIAGDVWTRNREKKFLQLYLTIEDEGVFTMPWTATITYAPGPTASAKVFAPRTGANTIRGKIQKESDVPKAERPDF